MAATHPQLLRAAAAFLLIGFCIGDDPQYRNCTRLFTCDKIEIGYPFWGRDRPRECGVSLLELQCGGDNSTTIDIAGERYRVLSINVSTNSMRIVRSDQLTDICDGAGESPAVDQYSDGDLVLRYSLEVRNLVLLYDCPHLNGLPAICSNNITSRAYAATESVVALNYRNGTGCGFNVTVPVMQSLKRNTTVTDPMEVLRQGFEVEYRMNGTSACDTCRRSNGLCWSGTNSSAIPTCLCANGPRQFACHNLRRKLGLKIGIGVGGSAFGATAMFMIFFIYHHRHKNRFVVLSEESNGSWNLPLSKELEEIGVHIFTYHELEEATNNFNPQRELGDGGYGTVYSGKLQDGRAVAVKKLHEYHFRRVEQFINEVELLARLKHQNLVSLYGCTSYSVKDLLLVYEYIPNGTLADHLHGDRAKPGSPSWIARLNIAIETASALAYLHASEVIHRDIKSSNILLDNNFTVKVADFGISRIRPTDATHISTAPQGTPGYLDPEYNEYYQLTEKSDVYSFGVVLMELISSKPAVDITRDRSEINLSTMAINKIQMNAVDELMDTHLGFVSDHKVRSMMGAVAALGFQCLQSGKEMRPHMQEVLEELLEIQSRDYSTSTYEVDDNMVLKRSCSLPISPYSVLADCRSKSNSEFSSVDYSNAFGL